MKIRAVLSTFILAGVTALLLSQRHAGFMLVLLAVPLLPWFVYSLYIIATQPVRRPVQAAKAIIWLVAVLAVLGIQYELYASTKAGAQEVVSAIQKYKTEHGVYPPDVEAAGLSKTQLKAKLGLSGYALESGKPSLFYASTFVPFETERYDFDSQHWTHVGD